MQLTYCAWRSWCPGARGPGYSWSRIPASRCHETPGICGFCDWFSHFHHAIFMIFYQLYLHKIVVSYVIVESRIRSNLFVLKALSSMSFNNFVMDSLRPLLLVELIHSCWNFAWKSPNKRCIERSQWYLSNLLVVLK